MPYKDFTISEVTQKFDLTLVGDEKFLPETEPIAIAKGILSSKYSAI